MMAVLLWLLYAFSGSCPVLGVGPIRNATVIVAVVVSALVLVMGVSWLILTFGFTGQSGEPPTQIQRLLIYIVVALPVTYFVLNYFGFDVRGVLATSAIITGIVPSAVELVDASAAELQG
ncbi:MAG: hypothetical protein JOZ17_13215 [Acetobacteraceae bacterium]|nr:hypothetical protein [Acetobacteraceae bacterium]